jgi:hypothetical protein
MLVVTMTKGDGRNFSTKMRENPSDKDKKAHDLLLAVLK